MKNKDLEKLIYYGVLEKEEDVYIIDFLGFNRCFASGDTIDETLYNAREALGAYLLDSVKNNEILPKKTHLEDIEKKYPNKKILPVSPIIYNENVRATITIPKNLLNKIDEIVKPYGRSQFFVQSAQEYLKHHKSA